MQASTQYLWPQIGSTGLIFSPQQLSSHNGFCGLQVRHVSLSLTGRDRSSSASYLCGWHHHHRQWLTGCHSSYLRTRPRVLNKRPRPTALFLGRGVSPYTAVSFSLNRSTLVTCFSDSRWMVSSLSARLWLLPVSSPRLLANFYLAILSIEVRLGLYNT